MPAKFKRSAEADVMNRNGLGISMLLLLLQALNADSSSRSDLADSGWSAVGGQTQPAYVVGGFRSDDTNGGHSVR